ITALEALAHGTGDGSITAAVPMGRDMICLQRFDVGRAESSPCLITCKEFANLLTKEDFGRFAVQDSIYERFLGSRAASRMTNAGLNIASRLCRATDSRFATEEIHPLFLEWNTST